MTIGHVRGRESRGPVGRWSGWVAASGLLHALLLGGLVSLMGSAARSPAILRARLVAENRAVSASPPERRLPPRPITSSVPRTFRGKVEQPFTPSPSTIAGIPDEPSPGPPLPSPASDREMAGLANPPGPPAGGSSGEEAARRPSEPPGEGEARVPSAHAGASGAHAEAATSPADEGRVNAPAQSDAARRGMFLDPEGGGSGAGRTGLGAAGLGSGTGGRGAGWGGQASPGGPGGGAAGIASRRGTGGSGDGNGVADLLRRIRRQIEEAKAYPDAARRESTQGTVNLRFRIAADGSVEATEILRSSGSPLLDEAAVQTIRRAGPYPPVAGWIRIPLSYRLDQ